MMRFIMFIPLIAAMESAPSPNGNLKASEVQGFVSGLSEIEAQDADMTNSFMDNIMAHTDKLQQGMGVHVDAFADLSVSPTIEISASSDMSGSFHDNNNAVSVDSDVQRVNGGMAVADFQNSLHNNDNAIGKGNVEVFNGDNIDLNTSINITINKTIEKSVEEKSEAKGESVEEKSKEKEESVKENTKEKEESVESDEKGDDFKLNTSIKVKDATGKSVEEKSEAKGEAVEEKPKKEESEAKNETEAKEESVEASHTSLLQMEQGPPSRRMGFLQKAQKPEPLHRVTEPLHRVMPQRNASEGRIAEILSAVRFIKKEAQKLGGGQDSDSMTLPSLVNESVRVRDQMHFPVGDSIHAGVHIRFKPAFNATVTTNMDGALYNNNNAMSQNGRVQRVNGAMVFANFNGAIYDNRKAESIDGTVQSNRKK